MENIILRHCATIVPRLMSEHGISENSCILQSRIVIESLKYFDIKSIPISCTAEVYNPPLSQRIQKEKRRITELFDDEWSVAIGFGEDRHHYWGGHLIVGSPNAWVMDPSIGQASRPQYGMNLNPIVAAMPPGFLDNRKDKSCNRYLIKQNDCLICYVVRLENRRYQKGGDWYEKSRWHRFVGMTIRSIKDNLSESEVKLKQI